MNSNVPAPAAAEITVTVEHPHPATPHLYASIRKTLEKYDNHPIVCNIVQCNTYLFRVQSC